MPGTYSVRVAIPGAAKPLSGGVAVEADPLPKFSAPDRAARQALLMRIYVWTKTLGEARASARALVGQRDSIAADFSAGGAADGRAKADSLNARIAAVSADVDRAFTAMNGQRAPIEAWSGLPSVDQRKSLGYAMEDAEKAVAALNTLRVVGHSSRVSGHGEERGTRKVKGVVARTAGR
jgi:hypothetical protein